MKGLTRLCLKFNSTFCYSNASRIPLLRRACDRKNFKLFRCQSNVGRNFDGPSLQDFIAKEALAGREELPDVESEVIPYVDGLDYNGRGRKVHFIIHGCQMNSSDIEIVWSILKSNGYEKTNEETKADVVLIMTCAIRDSAEDKIRTHLSRLGGYKRNNRKKALKVGVLGCMAERLKDKLILNQDVVDVVAGPDSYKDLPRLLAVTRTSQKAINVLLSLDETYADVMPVAINEDSPSAYVSITRGCDNMCTYCIVPFTRGRERSRPMESILREVKMLSEKGIKQVTLLGQNVNSYRDTSVSDSGNNPTKLVPGFKTVYKTKEGGIRFDVLLDNVSQIDPNMRIRFTSPHPKDFPDEVILNLILDGMHNTQVLYLIRDRQNVCACIHLPLQSGSNPVLERMRRGHTVEAYLDLVNHIRSIIPNVCFTTDIIVGFCGEKLEDHEQTLEVIRKVKYSFVYHYPYSMREKTTAYRRYEDDVPHAEKVRRCREVNRVFREVSLKVREEFVGQTQLILVEGNGSRGSRGMIHGRNDGNCSVFVPQGEVPVAPGSSVKREIQPGDYLAVRIERVNPQTSWATPLYHTSLVEFGETQSAEKVAAAAVE